MTYLFWLCGVSIEAVRLKVQFRGLSYCYSDILVCICGNYVQFHPRVSFLKALLLPCLICDHSLISFSFLLIVLSWLFGVN